MLNIKSTLGVFALSSALFVAAPVASYAADSASAITVSSSAQHHHKGDFKGHHRHQHAWKKLNLSDEQKDQMFELRHAQAPVLRNLHKDLKAARSELRELSQADSFDESKAKAASEKLATAQADIAFQQAKHHSELHGILTAEQRKTLSEMKQQRGKRGPAKAQNS